MPERSTDALELLLPEAAPQFWQRAQRVTTFLRLLSDDARGHGGASVAVSLARARGVFERSSLARCLRVHEELLRHHLYALVGCDSFAHFGECEGDLQSAWSEIEEQRAESPWIAQVPAPGESASSVARRLHAGLERSGASAMRIGLWRARLERAVQGPAAGERAFEQFLAALAADRSEPGLRLAGLAGLIECLLDRAAVRVARARLEAEGSRVFADPRLRRLCIWTRVLSGDDEGARSLCANAAHARGRLPRPLAELRARASNKASWLSGQVANEEPVEAALLEKFAGAPAQDAAAARPALGAALFSAWSLEAPGRARLVAHALAPAHRARFREWRASRQGACADPREYEGQLLGDGRTRIAHFDVQGKAPGDRPTIDSASILSTALVAVRNARADVCGWLTLEFEHHLVPSASQLERLAQAWSAHLAPCARAGVETVPLRLEDESSAAADVLRGFVDGLALKTTQRRWSAFDVRGDELVLVAQGGGALLDDRDEGCGSHESSARRGEGRAVARAAATGHSVSFTEADSQLCLHPDAASGVAVPLELSGRVAGVWLVESTRRRDFSESDVLRFEARAANLALDLAAAQFRSWHRARYGHDASVNSPGSSAGLRPAELVALAKSGAPIALSGPIGCGRRMLARRLHFESALRASPLKRARANVPELERLVESAAQPCGLIIERALDLDFAQQMHLAQWIEERSDSKWRIYLLFDRSLVAAAEAGALAPELAWLCSNVELKLAPLCRRRCEIAPLAQMFAAHFALRAGVRAPALDDGALGFLWRQTWNGNVRELAQWMQRLVLCSPGGAVDASVLENLGNRFGQETLQRIPSRHPDRELLCAALESTANRKGTWNKTRAALYLGWDTDTLQSRINEAGLGNSSANAPASDAAASNAAPV